MRDVYYSPHRVRRRRRRRRGTSFHRLRRRSEKLIRETLLVAADEGGLINFFPKKKNIGKRKSGRVRIALSDISFFSASHICQSDDVISGRRRRRRRLVSPRQGEQAIPLFPRLTPRLVSQK